MDTASLLPIAPVRDTPWWAEEKARAKIIAAANKVWAEGETDVCGVYVYSLPFLRENMKKLTALKSINKYVSLLHMQYISLKTPHSTPLLSSPLLPTSSGSSAHAPTMHPCCYCIAYDLILRFRLFYAIKANCNHEILRELNSHGVSFECVSLGELQLILTLFPDIPGSRVLYTPNFASKRE